MKPKWTKIGQRSWRVEQNGHALVLIKEADGTTTLDNPEVNVTIAKGLEWKLARKMALVALIEIEASMRRTCGIHAAPTPKSMKVEEALELVLDLARQNVISMQCFSDEKLKTERERQQTAIKTLEDYAVNVVSEGRDVQYCDSCGEVLQDDGVGYSELPFNVASANKGESAVICHACDQKLNPPKKHYRVRCAWQEMGDYWIDAKDEEEAKQIAMDEPLPDESSYVDGSFEIDGVEESK